MLKQNPDLIVFLGDLVYGGLYPRECLSLLQDMKPLIEIKGNSDCRFDGFDDKGQIFPKDYRDDIHCWIKDQMTDLEIGEIKLFKLQEFFPHKNISFGFFHGSPVSLSDRIYEDDPPEEIIKKFEKTNLTIAAVGHTHVRMHLKTPIIEIINPGAIGISNDGDTRAGYGILTINKSVQFQQRNIEYPVERYASEIELSSMPYKNMIANQIRTGEPNKSLFR